MRESLFIKIFLICLTCLFVAGVMSDSFAQDRFPRPEFDSEYQKPHTHAPGPQAKFFEIFDIFLLATLLGLTSYFVLKKRSRRAVFWISIFSLGYFGFYREGCVCAVGSLQNVSAALFLPSYVLPIGVIAFFILPLAFALFFGRTFCASVCPLGCMQDVVMLKPVKVPHWLSEVLGVLPYLYLGFAVLFATTGSAFIICRYDPFVSIFRLSNDFGTILYSAGFVGLSVFVARPYCRFLCPYGVLLGWMSSLSKKHASITPDYCTQCRLCEGSCDFGSIHKPSNGRIPERKAKSVKRLATLFILAPVMIIVSGWAVSNLDVLLSRMHPTVRTAEQVKLEDAGLVNQTTLESRTFRRMGTETSALYSEAQAIQKKFHTGGWFLGGFLGLFFATKLIRLSVLRPRIDYEINQTSCFSCARCFMSCPNEHIRLETLKGASLEPVERVS